MTNYRQDWSYSKHHKNYTNAQVDNNKNVNLQQQLLKYIKLNATKNNLQNVINNIDTFCQKHWMMNLGPQKALILQDIFKKYKPKNILELGGYCGYSSLVFAYITAGNVHTIQISDKYAKIAKQIQQFAGVSQRCHISIGTVSTLKDQIVSKGPYDAILIDHAKGLYKSDFELLEQYGVIKKGTLVLGDNIIYPGAPEYLNLLKSRKDYDNTLYHTFVQYCNLPDAILISQKLE